MSTSWTLPAGPEAAREARGALRGWLAGLGARPDGETSDRIVLAASEAAANAGVHGCPPVTLAAAAVAVPGGTEVIVTVTDADPVVPHPRHAAGLDEHGRGLDIIDAVTDWHTTTTGPGCKQVRFGVIVPGLAVSGADGSGGGRSGDPFGMTGLVPGATRRQVLAS